MKKSVPFNLRIRVLAALFLLLATYQNGSAFPGQPGTQPAITKPLAPTPTKTTALLKAQPLLFTENRGQVADDKGKARPDVLFTAHSGSTKVYLTTTGIHYQFAHTTYPDGYQQATNNITDPARQAALAKKVKTETYHFSVALAGANLHPTVRKEGESSYTENFFGSQYADGFTGVTSYEKVVYENVYPDIDWVIYSKGSRMEYDFVVHPGGNPAQIKLVIKDTKGISITKAGELLMTTTLGEVREQAPISYADGKKIDTRFKQNSDGSISFAVAAIPAGATLTIDPSVGWATYFGGSNTEVDAAGASLNTGVTNCTTDASGNVYLVGTTLSTGIAVGGYQTIFGGSQDGFIAKFNAAGTLLWSTYYGSSTTGATVNFDACVTDASGNIIVAARVNCSATGLATTGAYQSAPSSTASSQENLLVAKFDGSGGRTWATYYGTGTAPVIFPYGSTIDASGNIYISGYVAAPGFGLGSGIFQSAESSSSQDGFLAKFDGSTGFPAWFTYYGGTGIDQFKGCAVDGSGGVYVAGYAASTGLASSGTYQSAPTGTDAMLVKFDAATGGRVWATYYGGPLTDEGFACAADGLGNVYLTGETNSTSGIASTTGAIQGTLGGGNDAFIAQFDAATGATRNWGTYYGGTGTDLAMRCAVDANNNFFMVGTTGSTTGIYSGGFQATIGGGNDAMVVKVSASGVLQWGSYFGSTLAETGTGIAISGSHVYIAGATSSTTDLATTGQTTYGGSSNDAYLTQISNTPPCAPVYDTVKDTICVNQLPYTWNGKVITTAGAVAAVDTIVLASGCDSIVTLNLTVKAGTNVWDTFTHANTAGGLGNDLIRAYALDAAGNRWFGTYSGVSVFNGTTWTNYTNANDNFLGSAVLSIAIDASNVKWIGTNSGLVRFDGTTWTHYAAPGGVYVTAVTVDATGGVWVGTSNGTFKFNGSTWTPLPSGIIYNYVWYDKVDAAGNKWFATQGGVAKFDGTTWTNYTNASTSGGLAGDDVTGIAFDAAGNKWFSTASGVSMFNGTTWTAYTNASTGGGLVNNTVTGIAIDAAGNKWFGTSAGVSRFDGVSWTTYTTANGLLNNSINLTCVGVDAVGNKWFGTTVGLAELTTGCNQCTPTSSTENDTICINQLPYTWNGKKITTGGIAVAYDTLMNATGCDSIITLNLLAKPGTNVWKSYTKANTSNGLLNNEVRGIVTDASGTTWFANDAGLCTLNSTGTTWTNYTTGIGYAWAECVVIDAAGNKWVGTPSGASKLTGTTWTNYTSANTGNALGGDIYKILIDNSGSVWFCSKYQSATNVTGLAKFDPTTNTWTHYFANNYILAAGKDAAGNLWFGENNGGVYMYNGSTFTNYTTANGLVDNSIYSISRDSVGNLWFGGLSGGISEYNGSTWTNYLTATSHINGLVFAIAVDAVGNKWFGTGSNGLVKFDGTTWTAYTTADGLVSNNVESIDIDASGNKWLGTDMGVSELSITCICAPVYDTVKDTICANLLPYTWNGKTITAAGTVAAVDTLQNAAGCDSVVTLNLTVKPMVVPTVIIGATANTLCVSGTITLSPLTTNVGTTPSYQWKKNGNIVGNSLVYTDAGFNNGDIVTCTVTSSGDACAAPAAVTSANYVITVDQLVTPAIPITPSVTTLCAGTLVTFTAAPANGGTLPVYQWKKNGNNVGTNTTVYTDNTLNNNDVVSCVLTSNQFCITTPTATASVTMTVHPLPVVTASADTTMCAGSTVPLTATGGVTYAWSPATGLSSTTDASVSANPATTTKYIVTGTDNNGCAKNDTVNVVVHPLVTGMKITPVNPTICSGSSVLLSASPLTLLTQNFNGAGIPSGWSVAGTGSAASQWQPKPFGYLTTQATLHTPDGTQFFLAEGSAGGYAYKLTTLTTPVFSLRGLASASFSYYSWYDHDQTGPGNYDIFQGVEVSTDGGATWSTIDNPSIGGYNGVQTLALRTASLNSYVGQDNVIVRFHYESNHGYAWAIDNVAVTGTPVPVWSPVGTSYTNATMTNNYTGTAVNSVFAGPLTDTVYTATVPGTCIVSTTDTVTVAPLPVATISGSSSICSGNPATITFNGNNGATIKYKADTTSRTITLDATGSAVISPSFTTTDSTYTIVNVSLGACSQPISGQQAAVHVTPSVIPGIIVAATPKDSACLGTPITFTAIDSNGGTTPMYEWKKNGMTVGTNSGTYTDNNMHGNDIITATLTSNATCAMPATVISPDVIMDIQVPVVVSLSVASYPAVTAYAGQNVTFTASVNNGGVSPTFQWTKNGVNIPGATSDVYTTNTLQPDDSIACKVISNGTCVSPASVSSDPVGLVILCPVPVSVTETNITSYSADFNWHSSTGVNSYEYAFDQSVTAPASGIATTATSYNANNLIANATYYFHVRDICSQGNYSDWVTLTLTADLLSCYPPTTLTLDSILVGGAKFEWSAVSEVASYECVVNKIATDPGTAGISLTDTFYTATGLSSGVYYAHIRTHCEGGFTSPWELLSFAIPTTGVATVNADAFTVKAYPNPATSRVTIETSEIVPGSNPHIQVMDITGKVIRNLKADGNKTEIDINDVAAGMYLIRYTDSYHSEVIKITKQ